MANSLAFTKMVGAGNDFCVIDNSRGSFDRKKLVALAVRMCDRKFGAGADGILVLEKSRKADARMRIFNADGSEAEMCGNGSRCFARFLASRLGRSTGSFRIETLAGIIDSVVGKETVRVRLTDPGVMALDRPVKVLGRELRVSSVNTGVPHAIVFVEGLAGIDVHRLGRELRYHRAFAPAGTNVNFVEVTGPGSVSIRTYERGVEGETLACGTGSTASALVSNAKYGVGDGLVRVKTAGGEELRIHFTRGREGYTGVWLEGKAGIVYEGRFIHV